MVLLVDTGQSHLELGSFARLAIDRDIPIMSMSDTSSNSEAQPGADRCAAANCAVTSAVEGLKDMPQIVSGDALAIILYSNNDHPLLPIKLQGNDPIGCRTTILER
ncbi:MAG TPA: hypothetical protein VKX46_00690, partial [Ktedonobacteraceae bacterium]|nr:hypothetical protein [Ktedonobacteraceae bacterium]